MEKNNSNFIIIGISILLICAIGFGCFIIGRTYQRADPRAENKLIKAGRINNEIGNEQRRTIQGITGSIEIIERIRRITEETNSVIGEFRLVNRGSIDILDEIEERNRYLENYIRSVSVILSDYYSNNGNEIIPPYIKLLAAKSYVF